MDVLLPELTACFPNGRLKVSEMKPDKTKERSIERSNRCENTPAATEDGPFKTIGSHRRKRFLRLDRGSRCPTHYARAAAYLPAAGQLLGPTRLYWLG